MRLRPLLAITAAALPSIAPATTRPLVKLTISCAPDGRLDRILVGDREIAARPQTDGQALHAAIPNRRVDLVITGDASAPYRCIGGLIFELQRLGYSRVGFISAPPSPAP